MYFAKLAIAAIATAASFVSALPSIAKREPAVPSDVDVLNFACLLEDLENKFYKECTTKFKKEDYIRDGFDGSIFEEFLLINDHENTHFITLQQTIITVFGKDKLQPECEKGCSYKFPINSAKDCVTVASILERTGVSAYDGAIRFVENPDLKNAGAAIATIEGRHAAFLNLALHQLPVPNAFDIPLGVRPIFSLAAQFVDKCPRNIPILPFPLLAVEAGDGNPGDDLKLTFEVVISDADLAKSKVTLVFGLAQKNISPKAIRRLGGNKIEITATIPSDVQKFGEVIVFVVKEDKPVSVADDSAVISGPGSLIRKNVLVEIVKH